MSRIMGSVYIFILLTTLALFLMLFLSIFKSKVARVNTIYEYLNEALLWNYLIRLVFECCIELTFVLIFNGISFTNIFGSRNFLEFLDYAYTLIFSFCIIFCPQKSTI